MNNTLFKFILLVSMVLWGLTCDRNNENPVTDPLVLKLYITDASLPGKADGSINLEISGGMGPYTIQWSTGDTTEDIDNLLPGIYTVMVRDKLDETARDTAVVGACEPLKDIDGNAYTTVQIGIQQWMVENLRVTHTPDGDTIVSYCYDDDTSYARTFGRLYTWDVAMNGSVDESAQGICPDGYHIPSDDEWKKLEMHLGMTQSEADMENTWRGKGVGTKLGPGGTSGYEALYAGRLSPDGYYTFLNDYEYIWTSTENSKDTNYAWRRCLSKYADDVGRWNTFPKTWAFSVRCIKNQ